MKITIDVDELEKSGVITTQIASVLRAHAIRDVGSIAINILLLFGAIVVTFGLLSFVNSIWMAAFLGSVLIFFGWMMKTRHPFLLGKVGSIWISIGALLVSIPGLLPIHSIWVGIFLGGLFISLGCLIKYRMASEWLKLGNIWIIVGSLVTSSAILSIVTAKYDFFQLPIKILTFATILTVVSIIAEIQFLIALVPLLLLLLLLLLLDRIGFHQNAILFVVSSFSALAYVAWKGSRFLTGIYRNLVLVFASICVILVNLAFLSGTVTEIFDKISKNMSNHGLINGQFAHAIPQIVFVIAWAILLLLSGAWGAKRRNRFMVNTVAIFGIIHFYVQWIIHIGFDEKPWSIITAGIITIVFGIWLWSYNRKPAS